MSRGKRRRRKWNRKQYDIAVTKPDCICDAQKFGNKHLKSCAAYDGPYDVGTSKASDWNTYYCNKEHWRTAVALLEDKTVYASAWSDRPKWSGPAEEETFLDYGFYLDDLWTGNRITVSPGMELPVTARKPQIIHYPCVDQSSPGDIKSFQAMMEWILEMITEGKRVDVGCIGGHGRTGLTLASLLIVQGMDPWDAMNKIRTDYCSEAVESFTQEEFLGKFWSLVNDGEAPRENPFKKTYTKQVTNYSYGKTTPQKAIMEACPNCGRNVWYLDTHRSSCGGHPTDEELEKYKASQATTAVVVQNTATNVLKPCIRDNCRMNTVNQVMHDKVAHKEEYLKELKTVEDEVGFVHGMNDDDGPQDAEEYQEWLRMNTIENRRLGIEDADGSSGSWEPYDSWESREYDKRVAEVDEQCPYGSCRYPMECEPTEQGGCFREQTGQDRHKSLLEEARGWAGDM